MNENKIFLECEKLYVYCMLGFVGGFVGAFTYVLRGGVFCNAQTGNLLLMSMLIGKGDFMHACYYLLPACAYTIGIILSEYLPNPIKRRFKIRWDTLLIIIEIIVIIFLGFIPDSAPYQISHISVNIIMAMQYNTFRQSMGIPVATTFCTNNIRQIVLNIYKSVRNRAEEKYKIAFKTYSSIVFCFVAGAISSTFLSRYLHGRTILVTLFPLIIVLMSLFFADIKKEKKFMHLKPAGH